MRSLVLIAPIAILLFLVTTINNNAYATQFSFNPSTGELYSPVDMRLPVALVAITSAAGAFLIINERRKAKGIWFSDSGRLK